MNYEQAMAFLDHTKKYGSQLGLTNIRTLLFLLGNIQERVPAVHIAGTNGKGSVGAMLSAVLTAAGYRVGWFSTPDVFCYEEEFRLNGEPIRKERLAELFTVVSECCNKMVQMGCPHPTRFEVETAAAFLFFYEEKCEIAIIETGMGGETDATNVIGRPLVSILTPVSRDHMRFLGDSLEKIAQVKCGIIREGCPVVTARQDPTVMEVVAEHCRRKRAPCVIADADRNVKDVEILPGCGIAFSCRLSDGTEKGAGSIENTVRTIGDEVLEAESAFGIAGEEVLGTETVDTAAGNEALGAERAGKWSDLWGRVSGDAVLDAENVVRAAGSEALGAERAGKWSDRCGRTSGDAVLDAESAVGGTDYRVQSAGSEDFGRRSGGWLRIRVGLSGLFQAENALCVLEALRLLRRNYPRISAASVQEGLRDVRWHGRFEQIGVRPDFYLDGAHNEGAVRRLRKTLDAYFPERRLLYLMGVLADKEYRRMAELIFQPGDRVYTVTPDSPRALDGRSLADALADGGVRAIYCRTGREAVRRALDEALPDDAIVAFGSLSYLGEIREAYASITGHGCAEVLL